MSNKTLFKFGRKTGVVLGTAISLVAMAWPATPSLHAQTTAPSDTTADDSGADQTIVIQPGKSHKLPPFDYRIRKVNSLAPDIADYISLSPNQLLIIAKKPGSTQLIVWDEADHTQIINVEVATQVAMLQKRLQSLFPESTIKVEDANGTITLTGQVHDLETARRVEAASAPYSAKIVDLMEVGGGQQVMLRVKFAEVSKQAEQELGFNFGGQNGSAIFGSNIGPTALGSGSASTPTTLLLPTSALTSASMFGTGAFATEAFAYFIEALESNSLLRTLAEPNLVTTSGQKATFLAGGSFPYPVPQTGAGGGSTITIQWQQYGISLNFTPIVLGNGHIRLDVNPDVSALDYSHAYSIPGGGTVPGLTDRNVHTTVELSEGQTFALAGLLEDQVSATNSQFPFLGDIPVLGALFRSVTYQDNQDELVVLVTPVLVHGIDPADVTLVPGEHWRNPNNMQLYFLKDLGGPVPEPPSARPEYPNDQAPQYEGPAGFSPPPPANQAGK
jgi:pilus assembly protein CpaC